MRCSLVLSLLVLPAAALAGCAGPPVPAGETVAAADGASEDALVPPEVAPRFGMITWHPVEPHVGQSLRIRVWVDGTLPSVPSCNAKVGPDGARGGGQSIGLGMQPLGGNLFECEIVPATRTNFIAFFLAARDWDDAWLVSDLHVVPVKDGPGEGRPASTIREFDFTGVPGESLTARVLLEDAALANPLGTTTAAVDITRFPLGHNAVMSQGERLQYEEPGVLTATVPWAFPFERDPPPEQAAAARETDVAFIAYAMTTNAFDANAVSGAVLLHAGACKSATCLRGG